MTEKERLKCKYAESNYGRTKSFKIATPKIIKPVVDQYGYLKVRLNRDNKRRLYSVHILVAKAFVPNPEDKPQINHLDGCKMNNYLENLAWATASENQKHAVEMHLTKRGTEHYCSHLSENDVRYIRKVYKRGSREFGTRPLARKFGISHAAIRKIIREISYRYVTD